MADFVTNGEKTFPIAANIAQYLRVTPSSSVFVNGVPQVAAAGIADLTLGVTTRAGFVTTGPVGQTVKSAVAVRLMSAQGTILMTANGVITCAGAVYSAAAGKVAPTQGTGAVLLGYSLTTSTADGDIIEVLPL